MSIKSLGNPRSTYNAVWGQTAKGAVAPAPVPFSATGGTEFEPGNGYKYHVFTASGSLVVASAGSGSNFDYIVVGGGGGA